MTKPSTCKHRNEPNFSLWPGVLMSSVTCNSLGKFSWLDIYFFCQPLLPFKSVMVSISQVADEARRLSDSQELARALPLLFPF